MTQHPARQTVYGRRRGRKLRAGLEQLVQEVLPGVRIEPPAGEARLDLAGLFAAGRRELWLEIGFGAGEHLAWQAQQNPAVDFLGAEVYLNGVAAFLREMVRRELHNVRLFQGDGRELLACLPEACVDRVFILFPDPWRKARHHKRRIVRRQTLDLLSAILRDGAELRLATDHAGYLCWMLQRLCGHREFRWLADGPADWRRRPADWPPSRYEDKALAEGRRPTYLRFVRRPRAECRGGLGRPGIHPGVGPGIGPGIGPEKSLARGAAEG